MAVGIHLAVFSCMQGACAALQPYMEALEAKRGGKEGEMEKTFNIYEIGDK